MIEDSKRIDNFIKNIKNAKYYEAHEDLEAIWYPRRFEKSDEIKLIKGFINASVSFELLKKGKNKPSKKVWSNYLKYKKLIYSIDSLHIEKYKLIIDEIDKIKKNFI